MMTGADENMENRPRHRLLSAGEVLRIHSHVAVDATIRDANALESAVMRPGATFGGVDLLPALSEKAAALLTGILTSHPFSDGNKRTAWIATTVFLRFNGHTAPRINDENAVEFIIAQITEASARTASNAGTVGEDALHQTAKSLEALFSIDEDA